MAVTAHLVSTLLLVVAGTVLAWGWAPATSTTRRAGRIVSRFRRPLVSPPPRSQPIQNILLASSTQPFEDDNEDNDEEEDEEEEDILWQDARTNGTAVCRICASSDGEIPVSDGNVLPATLVQSDLLPKIDAIYHATSYSETSSLKYINSDKQRRQRSSSDVAGTNGGDGSDVEDRFDPEEERQMVSILRSSLEEAGFELLDRRDLDLCEALNAGYLLRLSIQPDLKTFDPNVGKEFYPEKFARDNDEADAADENGSTSIAPSLQDDDLLFDGRVLIFRRGYSQEVTVGRLLLPKLDYLQASIVQKSAAIVTRRLSSIERSLVNAASQISASIRRFVISKLSDLADAIPVNKATAYVKSKWSMNETHFSGNETNGNNTSNSKGGKILKLNRYGGSREQFVAAPDLNDAINPFLICDIDYDYDDSNATDHSGSFIEAVNTGVISCEYDSSQQRQGSLEEPMRLLKRVSISNLVDFFSPIGRQEVLKGFFQKAKLVEPTYEEVVVVWRPLPKKTKKPIAPPKALIEVAEIFGVEDKLPKKMKRRKAKREMTALPPLKIRAFTDVPMANLPAVLPKTKLVFRPADAFVFDTISLVSLAAVLASQRFDNPKFDLIAIVSVSFWIIRTFFRYSNKLARYDLLVNKFLTSRISHRGPGALKYLASEAASQKAARVGLLYTWLRDLSGGNVDGENGGSDGRNDERSKISREEILEKGSSEMNSLLSCNRLIKINTEAALDDLEDLGGMKFEKVINEEELRLALQARWNDIL